MQSAYSCKILTRSDLASCFAPPRGSQGGCVRSQSHKMLKIAETDKKSLVSEPKIQ